jgi:hypothetical protein
LITIRKAREDLTGISVPFLLMKLMFTVKLFAFALAVTLITTPITSIAINFDGTKNAYAQIQAGQSNLTLSNLIK